MAGVALGAADLIRAQGVGVTVVDPRWVKPLEPLAVELAGEHRLVASIEDNGRQGGIGASFSQALQAQQYRGDVQVHAVDQRYLHHAKRDAVLAANGLTSEAIAEAVLEQLGDKER